MIKVSVLYPHSDGTSFDMDYYLTRHVPLLRETLGAACKGLTVDAGLAVGTPGEPPVYIAMTHLLFDSVEDFENSFGPHADTILGDIPHYTGSQPAIQFSEVKL